MKKEINGVIVDGKSIITSLEIIKSVCEDNVGYEDCGNCPFYNDEARVCCITDLSPDNWTINDNKKWKALF